MSIAHHRIFAALLAVGLTAGITIAGGPPSNDDCANATAISDGTVAGSTVAATNDGFSGCSGGGQDVWYAYTPAKDGQLTASTCGGTFFDTVVGIWTDCPDNGGVEIACDDDTCGTASTAIANVDAGETYLIHISSWNGGSSGNYSLTVSLGEGGPGPGGTDGVDVVYTDIQSITNWGTIGGVRGYSLGSFTCNIGDQNLPWGSTSPLLAMNAFKLDNGRLVQTGMSFVKNGTIAFAGDGCGPPCNGNGGSVLGAGCLDVYGSSFNGGHGILGPRSSVNPFTGAYPGPAGGGGDAIFKRLQIAEADMTSPTARHFAEGQYIAAADAASGNALNNASYKPMSVDGSFNLIPTGTMTIGEPAIFAWRDHGLGPDTPDDRVEIIEVDVPDEGRYHIASKVTDLGKGMWRYDYAVRNLNSHRSAGSFAIPIGSGATITNVGFHDVDYHSGEPYDNTDWTATVGTDFVIWNSPATFAEDEDTNALRWGTMYNFWFDSDTPPLFADAELGLFRPGTPSSMAVSLRSPRSSCLADVTPDGGNQQVNFDDIVSTLNAFGPCNLCPQDIAPPGGNLMVNFDDLIEVINGFGPCP